MTQNQLRYAEYLEGKRHNLQTEEAARASLSETTRHNVSMERETNRSNVANEKIKSAANAINQQHNLATQAELARHNKATEAETARHNIAQEDQLSAQIQEAQRHNYVTEAVDRFKAKEIQRHNEAVESVDQFKATSEDTYRKGSLTETTRHNLAQENTNALNAISNMETAGARREEVSSRKKVDSSTVALNKQRVASLKRDDAVKESRLMLDVFSRFVDLFRKSPYEE